MTAPSVSSSSHAATASPDIDERDLLPRVLQRDDAAWRELVRRFSGDLRATVAATSDDALTEQDVSDVLGDFWLRLLEDDMKRLRAFDSTRGVPLATWLCVRAGQLAFERWVRRRAEPEMVPIAHARSIAGPESSSRPTGIMMRVEDVAERWDLNVKTVYAMIQRGEIAARRCGRVVRIPRRVVESFEQASVASERGK